MTNVVTSFAALRKPTHISYLLLATCLLLPIKSWAVIDTTQLILVDPSTVDVSISPEGKQDGARIHTVTLTNNSVDTLGAPIVVEIVSASTKSDKSPPL